jgi:hypothetical protein
MLSLLEHRLILVKIISSYTPEIQIPDYIHLTTMRKRRWRISVWISFRKEPVKISTIHMIKYNAGVAYVFPTLRSLERPGKRMKEIPQRLEDLDVSKSVNSLTLSV